MMEKTRSTFFFLQSVACLAAAKKAFAYVLAGWCVWGGTVCFVPSRAT
jgi:hypothetical protein